MNLKKLRLENCLTQEEVSKANGITRFTYSNYESGKTQPDYETLKRLADYFHTTTDNLLEHDVPYLLDKSILTAKQRNLVNIVSQLDDRLCDLTEAYIYGKLEGQAEQQANIERLKKRFE